MTADRPTPPRGYRRRPGGLYVPRTERRDLLLPIGGGEAIVVARGSHVGPSFAASGPGNDGNASAGVTVDVPAGVVEGDLLYAQLACTDNTGTPPAITASQTGWTPVVDHTSAQATATRHKIFRRIAGAGEPATYGFTSDAQLGDGFVGVIMLIRGYDRAAFEDVPISTATAQNTTTVVIPEVTTVTENTLLLAFVGAGNPAVRTFTPPTGMTEQVDNSTDPGRAANQGVAQVSFVGPGATGDKTYTASATTDELLGALIAVRPELSAPRPVVLAQAVDRSTRF